MDVKLFLRVYWDRLLAATCAIAGAVALLVGWLGVSGTALSYEQIPYIVSGGLVGVVLLGCAATLWLSADLRDEWRKLDSLDDNVRALVEVHQGQQAAASEIPGADGSARKRATTSNRSSKAAVS